MMPAIRGRAPMSDKPSFDVAVVGLDPQHLRLIEIVFRHIQYNRYVFRLAEPVDGSGADILIAGVGDPSGRAALERARARTPPMTGIAVVGPGESAGTLHALEVGQLVRQLLPILNRVVEIEGLAGGPRRAAAAAETVASAPPAELRCEIVLPTRPRVLLVEDDATERVRLTGAFDRLGVEVDAALNAGEALERLESGRFDLALLDLVLPEGGALRFARTVRAEPRWRGFPIVVIGPRRAPLDVIRSAVAGCSAYLAKPVDFADLQRTVARQLGRARKPGALPPQLRAAGSVT
jgi:CheY-like chemotaxis protein